MQMSKKKHHHHKNVNRESQLDFEEAKDLTVGQVIRKKEEVEAGVTPDDTILDKYIKQHRDEIEADKFENLQAKQEETTQSLDDLIQEIRENIKDEETDKVSEEYLTETTEIPVVESAPAVEELENPAFEDDSETVAVATNPEPVFSEENEEAVLLSRSAQSSEKPKNKKRWVILSILSCLFLLILGSGYYIYKQIARSSQEIQSQSAETGLVSNQAVLDQFNTLYDTFYTDENKTALKNSQFSQLSQLKDLLGKLEGAREYSLVKSKYDSLETQIKAIEDINVQFETPVITDGVLDTNAKVKSDAKFTEVKTGNTEIDKLLDKAISLGKSQQSSSETTTVSEASTASQTESTPSTESSSTTPARETAPRNNAANSGLSSEGVNLQRSVSRVPFNKSAISDSSNPAWEFNDGVLEQILATSRARGYITGNQYILERVNIINGNGYYNLYRPDGTYLFTLNCKTGYFVGNGSGHANDLDY
jgi:holliday junction-specific endonuclease